MISSTPIIDRGYRITVSRDDNGHTGWAEVPDGGTLGAGFIMGHLYADLPRSEAGARCHYCSSRHARDFMDALTRDSA